MEDDFVGEVPLHKARSIEIKLNRIDPDAGLSPYIKLHFLFAGLRIYCIFINST